MRERVFIHGPRLDQISGNLYSRLLDAMPGLSSAHRAYAYICIAAVEPRFIPVTVSLRLYS